MFLESRISARKSMHRRTYAFGQVITEVWFLQEKMLNNRWIFEYILSSIEHFYILVIMLHMHQLMHFYKLTILDTYYFYTSKSQLYSLYYVMNVLSIKLLSNYQFAYYSNVYEAEYIYRLIITIFFDVGFYQRLRWDLYVADDVNKLRWNGNYE